MTSIKRSFSPAHSAQNAAIAAKTRAVASARRTNPLAGQGLAAQAASASLKARATARAAAFRVHGGTPAASRGALIGASPEQLTPGRPAHSQSAAALTAPSDDPRSWGVSKDDLYPGYDHGSPHPNEMFNPNRLPYLAIGMT